MEQGTVLIPYSSGMGVGPYGVKMVAENFGLNTLFVRYGCGTAVNVQTADGGRS